MSESQKKSIFHPDDPELAQAQFILGALGYPRFYGLLASSNRIWLFSDKDPHRGLSFGTISCDRKVAEVYGVANFQKNGGLAWQKEPHQHQSVELSDAQVERYRKRNDVADDSDAEFWRELRLAQQKRRSERLPGGQKEIQSLKESGFTVQQLTAYQFRINGTLDLYPVHRRWHNIQTNKRGRYSDVNTIAEQVK